MSGFNVGDKMWYINLVEDDDDWANGCFPCEVAGFGSGTIKLKFDINNNGVSDAIVSPFPLIPKAMKADHKDGIIELPESANGIQWAPQSMEFPEAGIDDMVNLPVLNSAELNKNLKVRHKNNTCYCYTGPTLVAINLFKGVNMKLPNEDREVNPFGKEMQTAYIGQSLTRETMPPHCYAVANDCVNNLLYKRLGNQSFVITGESGAGKSYTTDKILKFICNIKPKEDPTSVAVADQVLAANPILEAFGNAKMPRNDDSSRFGKLFKLYFVNSGDIVGASISPFLLEKSRISIQASRERGYHSFYMMLEGSFFPDRALAGAKFLGFEPSAVPMLADLANFKTKYKLQDKLEYVFLNRFLRELKFKGPLGPPSDSKTQCSDKFRDKRKGDNDEWFGTEVDWNKAQAEYNNHSDVLVYQIWSAGKHYNPNPKEDPVGTEVWKYRDDAAMFGQLLSHFHACKVSPDYVDQILRVISSSLLCGNVEYTVDGKPETDPSVKLDQCKLKDEKTTKDIAELLKVSDKAFQADGTSFQGLSWCFYNETTMVGGKPLLAQLTLSKAMKYRAALGRTLYAEIFEALIKEINKTLCKTPPNRATEDWIGVLDIFGFEFVKKEKLNKDAGSKNSFEQLCINYCNERLQNFFVGYIFKLEIATYTDEGLGYLSEKLTFSDNTECVKLIDASKGILDEMNSMVKQRNEPKPGDKEHPRDKMFRENLHSRFGKNKSPYYGVVPSKREEPRYDPHFIVCHYAADVIYTTDDFVEKNEDKLTLDLYELLRRSACKETVAKRFEKAYQGMYGEASKSAGPPTVAGKFKRSLDSLLTILKDTTPNFVRCIKPNVPKKPDRYEGNLVLAQLKYTGMLETLTIRKIGYPDRFFPRDFVVRYRVISPTECDRHLGNSNLQTADCADVVKIFEEKVMARAAELNREQYRDSILVGRTRLFMKDYTKKALDDMRNEAYSISAMEIQAFTLACKEGPTFMDVRHRMLGVASQIRQYLAAVKTQAVAVVTAFDLSVTEMAAYRVEQGEEAKVAAQERVKVLKEEIYSKLLEEATASERFSRDKEGALLMCEEVYCAAGTTAKRIGGCQARFKSQLAAAQAKWSGIEASTGAFQTVPIVRRTRSVKPFQSAEKGQFKHKYTFSFSQK